MRNPIYTGWRVIDKRRDPSPRGRYVTRNGRQGDRRKVLRAPDEIIRRKVIAEPLVSERDFAHVQRIMDLKKSHHWRTWPGYESRFTYRGFMRCAICEGLIYTKFRRADYYVCKARHLKHTCVAGYMRREQLETHLDEFFSRQLTDIQFLKRLVRGLNSESQVPTADRLSANLNTLKTKRERVLDSYIEGVINVNERNARLQKIEREIETVSELLTQESPPSRLDAKHLASLFSPFVQFGSLGMNHKRRLLASIASEILVANYNVKGICVGNSISPGISHKDRGSSRPLT